MRINLEGAKEIELSDKPLFDKYFEKFSPEISELTFTNLFIWRKYYDFLFTEIEKHLLIFSKTYLTKWKTPNSVKKNPIYFIPPIGPYPGEMILQLFREFENIEFHKVPESIVEYIKEEFPFGNERFTILEDRNNWDYVYNKQDLISLAGNKYRQKRRWLNKFIEQYNYEFSIITEEHIDKVRELQIEWCDMNECQRNEDLLEEQKAIDEALDNYFKLNLKGCIICVDEKCVAYTLGEMLNNETAVIHIEKAHIDYEGSYQAINNLFLKNCFETAIFINREQDLGILGLRRAKESYKPHHMVKKSTIF